MVDLKEMKNGKSIKTLKRKEAELELVNAQTKQYVLGEVEETDFITLQCIKKAIKEKKQFGIKEEDNAMANIQGDMRKLCITGISINGVKEILKCKSYGRRAVYYNGQLARTMISAEKDKKVKASMTERLNKLDALEQRDGYIAK